MDQIDLFDDVLQAYAGSGRLSNNALYATLSATGKIPLEKWNEKKAIGEAGALHSPLKRTVRWYQQSLRALNLLEREDRGVWKLTTKGRSKLTAAPAGKVLLGFSTDLGLCLWSRAESVFPLLGEPIHLVLSSLPYPLRTPRKYGNPPEASYVDWVCNLMEPLVRQLVPGGSILLNVGADVFLEGSPARSLYVERLVLALADRYLLSKMDSLIMNNPCRPPGPMQWASRTRQQLVATYEYMLWFTNDPVNVRSDNRRVLKPHTEVHRKLIERGGETRSTSYGDGAHRVRPGSYASPTAGTIPRNVLTQSHNCIDKMALAKMAAAAGLPIHGATMNLKLAQFLIEFLSEPQDLIVDPCGGWMRTGKAAELSGRRWCATEQFAEYVLGASLSFQGAQGFQSFGSLASAPA